METQPEPPKSDEERYMWELARKRVYRRTGLNIHSISYLGVNLLLYLLYILITPERYPWYLWVLASWAVGWLFHMYAVTGTPHGGIAWHGYSYAVVNVYLIFIWTMTTFGGYMWFLWPAGFWAVGLTTHYVVVQIIRPKAGEDVSKSWMDRKIENELTRIRPLAPTDFRSCPHCSYRRDIAGRFCANCGYDYFST